MPSTVLVSAVGSAGEVGWVGHLYLGNRGREVAPVVGDEPVGAHAHRSGQMDGVRGFEQVTAERGRSPARRWPGLPDAGPAWASSPARMRTSSAALSRSGLLSTSGSGRTEPMPAIAPGATDREEGGDPLAERMIGHGGIDQRVGVEGVL